MEENTDYEFRVTVIRDHPSGEGTPSNTQMWATATDSNYAFLLSAFRSLYDISFSTKDIIVKTWTCLNAGNQLMTMLSLYRNDCHVC